MTLMDLLLKSLLPKHNRGPLGALLLGISFPLAASTTFNKHEKSLRELKGQMENVTKAAQECVPRKDQLCTRDNSDKSFLSKIKSYDLKACKYEINKENFKLLSEKEIGNKYPEFTNSTNRALTIYKEKLVLYKTNEFTRIDCLHELLHIYQHASDATGALSPKTLTHLENQFLNYLSLAVQEVEDAEKAGKVKEAQSMTEEIQPHIDFLKRFMSMKDSLLEKDIHYFIYHQCNEFKCTELDSDIALSNLFKLSSYFPTDVAQTIKTDASKLLAKKEEIALQDVKAKWKTTAFKDKEISHLLTLSWTDLINFIREQNIEINKVNNNVTIKELADSVIPQSIFDTIQLAPAELLKNSKVQSGDAFAKFLPTPKKNYIILTSIATRASLVHEYLHYLQFKHNKDYAYALLEGQNLMPRFLSGKITRQFYEEETMKTNVLYWMGEYEVYKTLLNYKGQISPLENQNNQEMYDFYKKKLAF
jgi:hypothetical protein